MDDYYKVEHYYNFDGVSLSSHELDLMKPSIYINAQGFKEVVAPFIDKAQKSFAALEKISIEECIPLHDFMIIFAHLVSNNEELKKEIDEAYNSLKIKGN